MKYVYAAVSVAVFAAAAWSGSATASAGGVSPGASVSGPYVRESGGEVVADTSTPDIPGVWLSDGSIVALVRAINAPAIAAARLQLQNYGSDTTMNFALMIFRDHAAMQHGLDSLVAAGRLEASLPAVADSLVSPYQTQLAALYGLWARDLDRRFISEQLAAHERAIADLGAFAGLAADPKLKALLFGRASTMERAHLASAQQLTTQIAAADSAEQAARATRRRARGR